jgi:polyhydroxyalkanoate synthesis regulator phasin
LPLYVTFVGQIPVTMEEQLKNLLYHGLGVVAITKEKVERAVEELVNKGKMTKEEGQKFYEELKAESGKAGHEFKDNLKESFRSFLENSGIPSREEFEALKKRVEALENASEANSAS